MSTEMQTHLSTLNKDPRAVRSRQALHQALLHLLEVKPLDQITIRDITKKSSVGYTTFFRHHPTKEALLDDVAAEQINALFSLSLPVMEAHDLRTASVELLTYVDKHRPLWSTLLTGGAAGTIRDEFLRQARQVAASQSPRKSRMPAELGVALIVSGVIELLAWWLRESDPLPINRIAEILDSVVVSPVIAAGSAEKPNGNGLMPDKRNVRTFGSRN